VGGPFEQWTSECCRFSGTELRRFTYIRCFACSFDVSQAKRSRVADLAGRPGSSTLLSAGPGRLELTCSGQSLKVRAADGMGAPSRSWSAVAPMDVQEKTCSDRETGESMGYLVNAADGLLGVEPPDPMVTTIA
jgi:hypothetical protein